MTMLAESPTTQYQQRIQADMTEMRYSRDLMAATIGIRSEELALFLQTGEAKPKTLTKIRAYVTGEEEPDMQPPKPEPIRLADVPPTDRGSRLPEGFAILPISNGRQPRFIRIANDTQISVAKKLRDDVQSSFVRAAVNGGALLLIPCDGKAANGVKVNANNVITAPELVSWLREHGAEDGKRYPAELKHGGWLVSIGGGK
jgi:hypothetical protein